MTNPTSPAHAGIDPNAPAYAHGDPTHGGSSGLTIRAEFAARADIPWNAIIETLKLRGFSDSQITVKMVLEYRAECAVVWADALISALNEKTKETT